MEQSCTTECSNETPLVLSAKEAKLLFTKRECLGKLIISIKGTITALSEVIRVGSAQMFLVELDKCVILVIKDFHLEWHSELEPETVFVFNSLRLTTLEKGISKPCSVFLVLAKSSYTKLTDENAVIPIPLQEWLKRNNMDISWFTETLEYEVDCENNQELINYEGTVTSTEMASSGIFVLDSKLRLLSLSSSTNLIRKHSRVFVYNAHIIKEGGCVYLVCCMKSCIRIHEPVSSVDYAADSSNRSAEVEDSADKVRIFFQNFVRKYGLNFREVTALLNLHSTLVRQGRSRKCQENIFVSFLKSCICTDLVKSSVKATDIFIYHDQLCPFNHSQSDGCRIPQVADLCSLKEEALKIQSSLDSDNCCLPESGIQVESSPYHLKLCSSNGKVLVGQIMMYSEGTLFQDSTDQLRNIILSQSDAIQSDRQSYSFDCDEYLKPGTKRFNPDSHHQSHLCCQCCVNRSQPGTLLVCPVLDPWVIGKTLCVRRFHIVLENYHKARTLNAVNCDKMNCDEVCMYLAFSLLDCILVDKTEISSSVSVGSTLASALSSIDLSSNLLGQEKLRKMSKWENETMCYVFVNEKQPLTYQFTKTQKCQFRILGTRLDLDLERRITMPCCKSCVKRSRNSEICSDEKAASEQEKSSLIDCNKLDSTPKRSESICATFSDFSSKWYTCITNGHLYKFTSKGSSDLDPFQPKFSQVRLQKVAEDCKVTMTIQMPEELHVERLPLILAEPSWGLEDVTPHFIQPVSQILSESFSETVVSFQGVIVSRDYAPSFVSHVNKKETLSMTNIKLEVREMVPHTNDKTVSSYSITVYLDTPRTVYTFGLVPGAVVTFHKVERKVSKAGNIYCRFIAISVAEVVKFQMMCGSMSGKSLMSQTQKVDLTDLPRELLINIWQCNMEDSGRENQTFRIHCHIDKIFKLSIKSVCSVCRSVYLKQGCQSRACVSSTHPISVSNAVLLVDDGTCPAIVKVWNPNLTRQLLTLTNSQWEDLVDSVMEHGEVLIDSTSPLTSTIAKFAHGLIESALVLRPCKMQIKRSKGSLFSTLDRIPIGGFQEKEVKVGKHFLKTFSLPWMQLECLTISEI